LIAAILASSFPMRSSSLRRVGMVERFEREMSE
jgi:hypothetical protein